MSRKSIHFFKVGAFSHANAQAQAFLAENFPEHPLRVVDVVEDLVMKSPSVLLAALWGVLLRYPAQFFRHRRDPRDFFCRTPVVCAYIKEWVVRNVSPETCLFTFQTQSLFDASHPDVPHFLFTDHTHHANRRYHGWVRPSIASDDWIAIERTIYPQALRNFTTSEFCSRSIIEDYGLAPERVVTVYAGGNTDETPASTPDDGKKASDPVILFVGLTWERKGGPELFEAFLKVLESIPRVRLWIVGCTPPVTHPRCRIFGRQPLAEVARLYRQATVFCLPSRHEPSAFALVEAARFGLPVVATDVGGTSDRVLDGVTGRVVVPGDGEALTAALLEVLTDPEKAAAMGCRGQALAEERFTWKAVGTAVTRGIREALSQKEFAAR